MLGRCATSQPETMFEDTCKLTLTKHLLPNKLRCHFNYVNQWTKRSPYKASTHLSFKGLHVAFTYYKRGNHPNVCWHISDARQNLGPMFFWVKKPENMALDGHDLVTPESTSDIPANQVSWFHSLIRFEKMATILKRNKFGPIFDNSS